MTTGLRSALLVATLALTLAVEGVGASRQPGPDTVVRSRVDAFVAALSSGQPATFEVMAREHCTPAFLQRRSPDDRAEIVRRVHEDFGVVAVQDVRWSGSDVVLQVQGSTGARGRITLTLEDTSSARIDRFGVDLRAGGGDDDTAFDPPPPITPDMSDAALRQALHGYLSTRASAGRFSGVVLVSRGGETFFAHGYGDADRDAQLPNTPDIRFNIGSINKSFTQVAIAKLMADGRLKPDDTIGALLPDYPNPAARDATVRQLLDHRGGIADIFGPAHAATPKDSLRSNADYFTLVAPQPLTFAPGARRQYCNGCYVVLGEIIARVSGQSYESFVGRHVFDTAGMTRTGFLGPEPRMADVAQGYTRRGGTGAELRRNVDVIGARGSAAGSAYATAGDLVKYVTALRSGVLLDRDDTSRLLGGEGPNAGLSLAGGAPGVNALLQARGDVIVVVLANMDPPDAERMGEAIAQRLAR